MKTFAHMLQEFPHDDKIDNLRHATSLSPKRQKQLSIPLVHFEDFDYDIWQGQYPPSNTSFETFNELKHLQSLQQYRDDATEDMIKQDKGIIGSFEKYLDEHELDVDMERIQEVFKESGAIVLALKQFYDRPRPKKLAKVLGIKLTEFQLKTAETSSYPSGHAVQGRLLSKLIADEIPSEHRANILDIGNRIGYYRQVAGAHYDSDTVFGYRLADELYRTVKIPVDLGEFKLFISEKMMGPNELVKSGGRRAKVLQKAIKDGTPLETDTGTFALTWINNSDKKSFASAIGKEKSDYYPSLKKSPGGQFKKVFKNEDGEEFSIKQLVKTAMFGGQGSSGEPLGADWENIITHHYNNLVGKPGHDSGATQAVKEKWEDFDEIGETIARNFIKEVGESGMTQYGAGKSSANLSQFWKNPAKGVKGGTDGTPKTDMYNNDYQISLKKAGGSQLASGSVGETLSTFYAALQHFSAGKKGNAVIDEVMTEIEENFEKLYTDKTKTDLENLSKDQDAQGKLSDKDKTALEGYITTEEFHKKFNKEMIPKLNGIKDALVFKEWLVFEAMSGYSKFKEKKAISSVCIEFNADNGSVTKFIKVTSNGKASGLVGSPSISGQIKSVAGKVKMYVAWKSSGGSPYSTFRIAGDGSDPDYDDTTLIGCVRKTIEEDKISQAFLSEETEQFDEFKFIGRTFAKLKKMGKNAIAWAKNLLKKILKAIKTALIKIKEMGERMFEGLFKFMGIAPSVSRPTKVPAKLEGFVTI